MRIESKSKLVMIGDSVTDCQRSKPVGEGLFDALGKGYVSMVDAMIHASHPEYEIRIVNMGLSGNNVRDLKTRWQNDVLNQEPDWVSVMIGVNDVWRQFDTPLQTQWQVPLDEYEKTLADLVKQTKPSVKGLVMMTPYIMEPNRKDAMRATMDKYSAVVRKLARKHGAIFVDIQGAFDTVLRHRHPMSLAWDRIHPNTTGHMIIANAFLDAIGFKRK